MRADAEHHADLFWSVRGGGGNLGVVTALEISSCCRSRDVYAGMLLWDSGRHAEVVLRTWVDVGSGRAGRGHHLLPVTRFPRCRELPDFLRGRQVVVVDGAVLGDDAFGEMQCRAAGARPEPRHVHPDAAPDLTRMHMDPEGPTPNVGGSAMLAGLDEAVIEDFLRVVGPERAPRCCSRSSATGGGARQAGPGRRRAVAPARRVRGVRSRDRGHPDLAVVGEAATDALSRRWRRTRRVVTTATSPSVPSMPARYDSATWERLRAVRAAVDPAGVFMANHQVGG